MIQSARIATVCAAASVLILVSVAAPVAGQKYAPYGDYPTTATAPHYPTTSRSPTTGNSPYMVNPNQQFYYTPPGQMNNTRRPWRLPQQNVPVAGAPQPPPANASFRPPSYNNGRPAAPLFAPPGPARTNNLAGPPAYPRTGDASPQAAQSANQPDRSVRPSGFSAAAPPLSGRSISARLSVFEPAQRIAQVGDHPILAGDVMGLVNQVLEANREKLAGFPPEEIERQKELLTRQLLKSAIENKILYVGFVRALRTKLDADKFAEAFPRIREDAIRSFDENELEIAMEKAGASSIAELDAKLRQYGTSLQKQREAYIERELGKAGVGQGINRNPEVTYDEMLAYYQANIEDYRIHAKARWEQLTALFEKLPSERAAHAAISRWGSEILYGGAPFAAVARRNSQDFAAENGGLHDWTTRGSLASEVLDRAIFSYPLHELSPILKDERGFHIIRVVERHEEGRISFLKAQEEIKEKLLAQKRNEEIAKYLQQLRKNVRVWTIFDEEESDARSAERPTRYGAVR